MRILHRVIAAVGGYFWLPCPVCGRMFGGHEVDHRTGSAIVDGRSMVVCPRPACSYSAGFDAAMQGCILMVGRESCVAVALQTAINENGPARDRRAVSTT
jgi:hypothetical protein